MIKIKAFLTALLLSGLSASSCFAQGTGQLGPYQFWANNLPASGLAQPTSLVPLTLNPPANSTTQSLSISQSNPAVGSQAGPISGNIINYIDNGITASGSGFDAFGQIQALTSGLKINDRVTGGTSNSHAALSIGTQVTADNGGTFAFGGGIDVAGNAATAFNWSSLAYVKVENGITANAIIGYEAEMLISNTGAASKRVGFSALSQGGGQGSTLDAAITTSIYNPAQIGTGNSSPWKNFAYFSNTLYGANSQSIDPAGSIFGSDAMSIANFANLSNVTVTGSILSFPNLTVAGSGRASFGTSTLPTDGIYATCSSCGGAQSFGQANGTSNNDGFVAKDSSGNNSIFTGVAEASNTLTRFGQTTGNWAQVAIQGSTNNGLLLGTLTAKPILFGTNNTEYARLLTGLMVGTTVDPGSGVVNVGTGYRIGNAATSGNVLRGNGTNFVSAQLAAADLSNGVTGSGNVVLATGPTISSPLISAHYGGSAAGSTALINGTSNGTPSNAYLSLQSNGQFVSIGNPTPHAPLDINMNLSSAPAALLSSSLIIAQQADGSSGGQEWTTYTSLNATGNILAGGVATGTSASPGATGAGGVNQYMFNLRGYGYNAGWQVGGVLQIANTETWSTGHQGTGFYFYTTPNATTSATQAAQLLSGFSVGTGTDPGAGNILAAKFVQTGVTTVASLPTCNASTKGARYFVTDANANTFHTTAAGGGANNMGVTCDGTNWYLS